jgi:hypothetical protein
MTLILGAIRRDGSVQVTDRLLTIGDAEFDLRANKNVVYVTPDARLAIAYTGLAYLDNTPTDEWIARQLWGRDFFRELAPGFPDLEYRGPPVAIFRSRELADKLAAEITRAYGRLTQPRDIALPLTVVITGCERQQYGAVYAVIHKPAGVETAAVDWELLQRASLYALPESNFPERMVDDLDRTLEGVANIDDTERVLVNFVQMVAQTNKRVGPNCVAIHIARPETPLVRVRYYGHRGAMRSRMKGAPRFVSAWYGPWVVADTGYRKAAEYAGWGFPARFPCCSVFFEDAEARTPSTFGIVGPARRPPPP